MKKIKALQATQQSFAKKRLFIFVAIIGCAAIAGIAIWYVYTHKAQPDTAPATNPTTGTIDYGPPSQGASQIAQQQKDQIVQSTQQPQTPSKDIVVTITRAGQGTPGDPLSVRAFITGTTSGSCELTLTKATATPIVKTFPIQVDATTSSCGAADVPLDAFASPGTWHLQLVAKNGNTISSPVYADVEIKK